MLKRDFLKTSIAASLALAAFGPTRAHAVVKPKRILVLGGTLFLGPPFVEAAIANGHSITLFNRGVTNPELFPEVEKLRGYRSAHPDDENLSALGRRRWDVVVDVWPNDPALAESAARKLADRTDHYIYVSSIGAYDIEDWARPNLTEEAPLAPWNSNQRGYNRGKAESERRLSEIVGDKLMIVRPGAIKGRRDDTPDMYVWLKRLQDRDAVLAPGNGSTPVQIVDVRDVADFMLLAVDRSVHGVFNVTGKEVSFRDFLEACRSATHSSGEIVWVPQAFLEKQGPQDWHRDYPYFAPQSDKPNFFRISTQKARAAGWETRPLRYTAMESLAYFGGLENFQFHDPIPAPQQDALLTKWRQAQT
jgi:2'-hydroxyisoflavone reductase